MAAPGSVLSNVVTVTEAAAPFTIAITATPLTLPYTGGAVTILVTTNLPDGTTLNLLANGAQIDSTTSTGGAAAFTETVAANTTTTAISIAYQVTN
jgi:hypothetical protein